MKRGAAERPKFVHVVGATLLSMAACGRPNHSQADASALAAATSAFAASSAPALSSDPLPPAAPFDKAAAVAELTKTMRSAKDAQAYVEAVAVVASRTGFDANYIFTQGKRFAGVGLRGKNLDDATAAMLDVAAAAGESAGVTFVATYERAVLRGHAVAEDLDDLDRAGLPKTAVLLKLRARNGGAPIADLERGAIAPAQLITAAMDTVLDHLDDGKSLGIAAMAHAKRAQ